ncbi:hypothetical protein AAMO2058_001092500 [Amorphochlora amoebiformis]
MDSDSNNSDHEQRNSFPNSSLSDLTAFEVRGVFADIQGGTLARERGRRLGGEHGHRIGEDVYIASN